MSTNRQEEARRHDSFPLQAQSVKQERSRVIELGLIALSSALLYLSAFSLPYSLSRLHTYAHLDLERFQIGNHQVSWPLLGALIFEGVLYWMACQTTRQVQGRAAWGVVLGGAALSAVALLPFYPLGSTDIFDYIMHGRMTGLYGANPFVRLASQFSADPFAYYTGWPNAPSAYGPLWEALAGLVARLPGDGVIPNVIAFKLLEGIFLAGTAATVALILRRVAPRRALTGVLLLTWNPILLYETMGNGHNDIAMAFCITLAVLAILYRRYTAGVLALVAGALIKFIPALMVPAAALIALRELPDTRARARFLLLTAPAAAALIVLAYAPFWDGLAVLSIGRRTELFTNSLPTLVAYLLASGTGLERARAIVSLAAAGLTMLFSLLEGVRAWRDRTWSSFARSAFHISMFYLLFTALWLWPWYSAWPLALAAILPMGEATLMALAWASGMTLRPFIFGVLVLAYPAATGAAQQIPLSAGVLALPALAGAYLLLERGVCGLRKG